MTKEELHEFCKKYVEADRDHLAYISKFLTESINGKIIHEAEIPFTQETMAESEKKEKVVEQTLKEWGDATKQFRMEQGWD